MLYRGVYLVLMEFVSWSTLMRMTESVEVTVPVPVNGIVSS